jgi:hypothetical protein
MSKDHVLEGMADELRAVLVRQGLDPKNPPDAGVHGAPPAEAALQEYKRRGGQRYEIAGVFVRDLIAKVKEG